MTSIQTILHPTDFSDQSRYALQVACSLARDHASKLIVLHVVEQPLFVPGEGLSVLATPSLDDARKALEEQLHRLRPIYPHLTLEHRVVEGSVTASILQAAHDLTADLVVIGTHGRTGLGRLLMGSVAEKIVRGAPCPVLSVKMPMPAAD